MKSRIESRQVYLRQPQAVRSIDMQQVSLNPKPQEQDGDIFDAANSVPAKKVRTTTGAGLILAVGVVFSAFFVNGGSVDGARNSFTMPEKNPPCVDVNGVEIK